MTSKLYLHFGFMITFKNLLCLFLKPMLNIIKLNLGLMPAWTVAGISNIGAVISRMSLILTIMSAWAVMGIVILFIISLTDFNEESQKSL